MNNRKLHSARKSNIYKLLFVTVLSGIYINVTAGTWQQQVSGISNSLMSVFFLNEYVGWTVGSYGAILRTTDGGGTWDLQTSGTNEDLNCVYFLDTAKGWVSGSEGAILKTTDGGNSWSPQNSLTVYDLYSIYFASDSTGWAVGEAGTIIKTTNGGTNWLPVGNPFSGYITDVDFSDSLNGWAAAFESGAVSSTVLKTTDGGESWQLVTVATFPPWPVFSVDFVDQNTGWLVGFIEVIFKSTDGGNTWIEQQGVSSVPEAFRSVSFADEYNGWTVGDEGVIAHTSDGGNLWTAETSGTTNILWDVFFVDSTTGWTVGDNGIILKYTIPVLAEDKARIPHDKFILYSNYPNPFNPLTTIEYVIPKSGNIKLEVYNSLGEKVSILVNGFKQAGNYQVDFNGTDMSSGTYFYRLQAGSFVETRKMLLIK